MGGIIYLVLPEIKVADIIQMRKPHPCGGDTWKVFRLGADIGLECCQCQRRILIPRRDLAHRMKKILPRENDESTPS